MDCKHLPPAYAVIDPNPASTMYAPAVNVIFPEPSAPLEDITGIDWDCVPGHVKEVADQSRRMRLIAGTALTISGVALAGTAVYAALFFTATPVTVLTVVGGLALAGTVCTVFGIYLLATRSKDDIEYRDQYEVRQIAKRELVGKSIPAADAIWKLYGSCGILTRNEVNKLLALDLSTLSYQNLVAKHGSFHDYLDEQNLAALRNKFQDHALTSRKGLIEIRKLPFASLKGFSDSESFCQAVVDQTLAGKQPSAELYRSFITQHGDAQEYLSGDNKQIFEASYQLSLEVSPEQVLLQEEAHAAKTLAKGGSYDSFKAILTSEKFSPEFCQEHAKTLNRQTLKLLETVTLWKAASDFPNVFRLKVVQASDKLVNGQTLQEQLVSELQNSSLESISMNVPPVLLPFLLGTPFLNNLLVKALDANAKACLAYDLKDIQNLEIKFAYQHHLFSSTLTQIISTHRANYMEKRNDYQKKEAELSQPARREELNAEFKRERDRIAQTLHSAEVKVSDLNQEREKFKGMLDSLTLEYNKLRIEKNHLSEAISSLGEQIRTKHARLSELSQRQFAREREIGTLHATLRTLDHTINAQKQTFERVMRSTEGERSSLQQRKTDLQREKHSFEETTKALKELPTKEAKYRNLEYALGKPAEKSMQELREAMQTKTVTGFGQAISTLTEKQAFKNELERIESDRSQAVKLHSEIKALKEREALLKKARPLDEISREMGQIEAKLNQLLQERESFRKPIEDLTKQKVDCQNKLTVVQAEQSEWENLPQTIAQLSQEKQIAATEQDYGYPARIQQNLEEQNQLQQKLRLNQRSLEHLQEENARKQAEMQNKLKEAKSKMDDALTSLENHVEQAKIRLKQQFSIDERNMLAAFKNALAA